MWRVPSWASLNSDQTCPLGINTIKIQTNSPRITNWMNIVAASQLPYSLSYRPILRHLSHLTLAHGSVPLLNRMHLQSWNNATVPSSGHNPDWETCFLTCWLHGHSYLQIPLWWLALSYQCLAHSQYVINIWNEPVQSECLVNNLLDG